MFFLISLAVVLILLSNGRYSGVRYLENGNAPEPANSKVYLIFAALVYALIGALQFGVGSDYFHYIRIYNDPVELELYRKKGELAFYYLVKVFNGLGLHHQYLFLAASAICSLLLFNLLRLLEKEGFNIVLIFFLFFVVTTMAHNQLNVIRTYVAVYAVLNAIAYKFNGRLMVGAVFFVFALLWHQSAVIALPFLILPRYFYSSLVFNNLVKFYIVFFLLYIFGIPYRFLSLLLDYFLPFYSHYISLAESGSIVNVLSKVIYMPFHFVFLWLLYSKRLVIGGEFSKGVVSLWALTANFYFLIYYWFHFFRPYHYFMFFSIVPLYYVLTYFKKNNASLFYLSVIYLIVPYVLKVAFFSEGEYQYREFIFSPFLIFG